MSTDSLAPHSVDVAVVTDRAYLPWCATTMLSCREATTDADVRFHAVVADDVSSSDRERLARAAGDITFVDIDGPLIDGLPPKGGLLGGLVGWVRTLLAELLPGVDRVVYLDADTLVRRSVLPLWDALGGRPIAAVTNVTHPAMYPHLRSLGFNDPTEYFNSGVLVMDLDAWRIEGSGTRLAKVVRSRPLVWPDQDALNVVFAGRWTRLQPVWNAMNSLWGWADYAAAAFSTEELELARTDPAILHFEGPAFVKPWHYLNQHPFRDEYRATLERTAWAGEPVNGRTVATRLIALLAGEHRLRTYESWKHASDRARHLPASARHRAINVSARARAKARNPRVSTAVCADENVLLQGTLKRYFETGEDAFEQIRIGMAAAGISEPRRVLDVPSGYGQVLRYMRAAWPDAELVAMEVRTGAPEFCAAAFRAHPVQSANAPWSVEGVGDNFELVWSGSLFTHFDSDAWAPTLAYLRDRLSPGGALIFATHGERSINHLVRNRATVESLRSARQDWTGDRGVGDAPMPIVEQVRAKGFAFEDYGWGGTVKWGVSLSTPEWVRATVAEVGGLEEVRHVPHGWSEHQDVFTFIRTQK